MVELGRDAPLEFLLELFSRKNPDGSWVFSAETVADFVPALLLSFGYEAEGLPRPVYLAMGAFALKVGIEKDMPKAVCEAKIQAYFEANPLDERLVFEFHRGVREELIVRGHPELAAAFGRLLPAESKMNAMTAKERPEGSIRGGPLARFQMPGADQPAKAPKKKKSRR